MRHARAIVAALGVAFLLGCSVSSSKSPSSPSSTVTSLQVLGTSSLTVTNPSSQLSAMATFGDKSVLNATAQAAWQSSDPSVAGVSPSGLVTAVSAGSAEIRASYQGASGSLQVTAANLRPAEGTWATSGMHSTDRRRRDGDADAAVVIQTCNAKRQT
jgi:hypothetical protein